MRFPFLTAAACAALVVSCADRTVIERASLRDPASPIPSQLRMRSQRLPAEIAFENGESIVVRDVLAGEDTTTYLRSDSTRGASATAAIRTISIVDRRRGLMQGLGYGVAGGSAFAFALIIAGATREENHTDIGPFTLMAAGAAFGAAIGALDGAVEGARETYRIVSHAEAAGDSIRPRAPSGR